MSRLAYAAIAIGLLLALYLVENKPDGNPSGNPFGNQSGNQSGNPSQDAQHHTGSVPLIKDYAAARPLLWNTVYAEGGHTLYCGEPFDSSLREGINVEHVFPMSWVKNALACGTRKQCQQNSSQFNLIEADLHNLYPSRSDTNHDRASFRFGEINGEARRYGRNCDFEVDSRNRVVEPSPAVRGDIARAMFYMADRYKEQGLTIFARSGRLLHAWHKTDPPDQLERLRNQRIEALQGNRNRFIDDPEKLDQLIEAGYFF